ncbi:hypothetical protein [Corynebacterium sputi]|uniref:hypothetical protein n=1 Tax=Corynebacterium sputi TaxID=489915 RepID=UPI0004035C1B|nr:hypothetical protein [Corynebacterium sputi]
MPVSSALSSSSISLDPSLVSTASSAMRGLSAASSVVPAVPGALSALAAGGTGVVQAGATAMPGISGVVKFCTAAATAATVQADRIMQLGGFAGAAANSLDSVVGAVSDHELNTSSAMDNLSGQVIV